MKTCPDCAESVQDAARKCRYCGFRFDEAPTVVGRPASSTPTGSDEADEVEDDEAGDDARTLVTAPSGGGAAAAGAAGGAMLLALGGLAYLVSVILGVLHQLHVAPVGALAGWVHAGAAAGIAIAWFLMAPSGRGSVAAGLGALAVPAATVVSVLMAQEGFQQHEVGLRLLLAVPSIGLAVMMIVHFNALEFDAEFSLARLAALFAGIGAAVLAVALVKDWGLGEGILMTLGILCLIGRGLFGVGLMVGALARR